jgi:hypothetical protein
VTAEFDFISEREQLLWVSDFASSLPERLRG